MSDLEDNDLVSKWVQAMNALFVTGNEAWRPVVEDLHKEILRRHLGLKCMNVRMVQE